MFKQLRLKYQMYHVNESRKSLKGVKVFPQVLLKFAIQSDFFQKEIISNIFHPL